MKTFILGLILLLNSTLFGQITLEQSYTGSYEEDFGLVMLENSGKKYFFYEQDSYVLNLYNLDHSLYKSINIDITSIVDTSIYTGADNQKINYITENLFDLDNELEFLFSYYYYDPSSNASLDGTLIFNEDGSIIFNEPNFQGVYASYPNSNFHTVIENTENGTKMFLQNDGIINIYNLPGSLPCTNLCSDSLTNGLKLPEIENEINSSISAYPNPTIDYINVDYTLPQGIDQGEIVLCDFQGKEIKRYRVDRTFDYLKISTNDIPQGVYIFNLKTSQGISEGKRIIKID